MSRKLAADSHSGSPWRWAALILALAGAGSSMPRLLSSLIAEACDGLAADQGLAYVAADGQSPPAAAVHGMAMPDDDALAALATDRCCAETDDASAPAARSLPRRSAPALSAADSPARAVMCTRMVLERQALGCLWLARRTGPPFTDDEREALDLIGQLAALAVRNARLHTLEQRALEELQQAEKTKTEFLSTVSHELRTPLTAIKASAGLLLDERADPITPTQRRLLGSIVRNADRLTHLVGDLLDMARLQDGQLPLSCTQIDVRSLARTCVAALQPLLDQKGQIVEVRIPHDLSRIIADRRRIEQVITNLLSNAHKYTPRGGRITLSAANEGDNIRLTVADTGPGIPVAERDLIFRRFYRGVSAQEGPVAGAGLGLSVARSLVELHGGTIAYRDAPGGGSAFDVILPVRGPGEAEL